MKKTFEEFLMFKHAEQYIGTKDCMVDDCADWIGNLDGEDLLKYGDQFAKEQIKDLLEACKYASGYLEGLLKHENRGKAILDALNQAIAKAEGGE